MKDLNYYKENAEEDYLNTPISVLKYIEKLEGELKPKKDILEITKFQLEQIKDSLRITANIHNSRNLGKPLRSCHDRMVTQAEQYVINALEGNIDKQVKYI